MTTPAPQTPKKKKKAYKGPKTYKGASRSASCQNKQAFPNADVARKAILSVKARKPHLGWMEPYKCTFCGQFHYGHARGAGGSRSFRVVSLIDRALAEDKRKAAEAA